MMKEWGGNDFWARTAPEDSIVNNIGQLPCASASVLRYTASVLASVSEAAASVLVSVSASTALVTTLIFCHSRAVTTYG